MPKHEVVRKMGGNGVGSKMTRCRNGSHARSRVREQDLRGAVMGGSGVLGLVDGGFACKENHNVANVLLKKIWEGKGISFQMNSQKEKNLSSQVSHGHFHCVLSKVQGSKPILFSALKLPNVVRKFCGGSTTGTPLVYSFTGSPSMQNREGASATFKADRRNSIQIMDEASAAVFHKKDDNRRPMAVRQEPRTTAPLAPRLSAHSRIGRPGKRYASRQTPRQMAASSYSKIPIFRSAESMHWGRWQCVTQDAVWPPSKITAAQWPEPSASV